MIGRVSALLGCALLALCASGPEAGAIIKKKLAKPVTTEPSRGTRADFEADRVTYDPNTKIAVATGSVRITYGPYVLVATKVVYNQAKDTFTANGSVILNEPNGNVMTATRVFLSNKFKDGFAYHLQALLTNNVTITADYAVRKEGERTIYEHSSYTACGGCKTRFGKPLWEVVADQTEHDEKTKTLYHTNARLKIGGVTVGGLPYISMPDPTVKRRTGFLPPTFKSGHRFGFGVIVPYYWELAPNADLTFSPLITTKQGLVADVEWRHRVARGTYSVRGFGVQELNYSSPGNSTRAGIKSKGRFKAAKDWHWGWDALAATDRTFLRHYAFDYDQVGTNDLYLTGLWDQTYFDARAIRYTALDSDVDWDAMPTVLPYVTGQQVINEPLLNGQLTFDWSSYSLTRDKSGTPFSEIEHGTSQSRSVLDMRWKKQLFMDGGQVLTPFARVRSDLYINNNVPELDNPTVTQDRNTVARVLPAAGIDMRWPFLAQQFGGQGIMSPVMQVIAATDETDRSKIANEDSITTNFDHSSLFLDDRFTGLDRYEGGSRINAGLTYSWFGAGAAFAKASIGESFHIGGGNSFGLGSGLEGSKSDLVAAITAQPVSWLNFNYETRLEEDLSKFNRHEASVGLNFDGISGLVGYQYLSAEPTAGRAVAEEFGFASGRARISDGWFAFGNASYDLQDNFLRNTSLGIEFDCDCMNSKLTYSRNQSSKDAAPDNRLMFSIELATLGGTSASTGF